MRLAVTRWWWRKYVAAVGWPLNTVCLASLAVVCFHDFVFAGTPELFQNAGKVLYLLYQLSLALLASYVFFYVNIHLPRQRDRKNVHQFLNEKTFHIVQDAQHIVNGLRHSSGCDVKDDYPSLPDLEGMCSKVHPYAKAPLFFGDLMRSANWMEDLVHFRKSTKETVGSIYKIIPLLDSGYLKLVMDIDDCSYFSHLKDVGSARMRNDDISFLADMLYDYLQKVKRLRNYAHREFGDTPYGGQYKADSR